MMMLLVGNSLKYGKILITRGKTLIARICRVGENDLALSKVMKTNESKFKV